MYPKDLPDYFYQTRFFQHHKPCSKLLYILYTFSAGMYYEHYIHRWLKYLLIFIGFVSLSFLIANYTMIFLQEKTPELDLILFAVSTTAFYIGLLSSICINYNSRNAIHRVLDVLNMLEQVKYAPSQPDEDEKYKVYDFVKYITSSYKFLLIFSFIIVWLGKVIVILIKGFPFEVDPVYDYLYPLPWAKSSQISHFLLVHHLQFAMLLLPILNFISSTVLLLSFPAYFNNQLVLLRREMRMKSQSMFEIFEQFYGTEIFMFDYKLAPRGLESLEMTNKHKIFCKKYFYIYIGWIRRYQQMIA